MKSHGRASARGWAARRQALQQGWEGVFDSQRCRPSCMPGWDIPGEAEPVGLGDVMGEGHPRGWQR